MAGQIVNMRVYDQEIYEEIGEMVAQNLEAFNAASNNCITLDSEFAQGDYIRRAVYAEFSAALQRRDITSQATVAETPLTQNEDVDVKIGGLIGPLNIPSSVLKWAGQDPAGAIAYIAEESTKLIIQDILNTGIGAAVAAFENVAAVTNDVSLTSKITQSVMNDTLALFGDASTRLTTMIMTGTQYHNFVGEALANANTLFSIDGVMIVSVLGRTIVVTDVPALRTADPFQKVLALSAGAITIHQTGLETRFDEPIGEENPTQKWQLWYDFTAGLKGYAWDITNGGRSPDNTTIFTGSNWDIYVSDVKNSAGVIAVGQE